MTTATLPLEELRARLQQTFAWLGDRTDDGSWADITAWWRDPEVVASLGSALADRFSEERPTVILGLQSRGCLLGVLVAQHLGLGFVEIRKNPVHTTDSDRLWRRTTPPDYQDRHLSLGFRRDLVRSGDRVLLIDDWIASGAQALASQALVADAGATWLGMSVIVNGLVRPELRRPLKLRNLLHIREL